MAPTATRASSVAVASDRHAAKWAASSRASRASSAGSSRATAGASSSKRLQPPQSVSAGSSSSSAAGAAPGRFARIAPTSSTVDADGASADWSRW